MTPLLCLFFQKLAWNDFNQSTHANEKEMSIILKKVIIALGVFITFYSAPSYIPSIAFTQQEVPDYAQWGQLAIKETQIKYPNASIIDYLHEGSELKEDSTIEKFKLWLKEDDIEFGILARIEYNTETKEVINIEIKRSLN